ncbi:hypothetical protein AKJ16_DCAP16777 [Drosera capensis]
MSRLLHFPLHSASFISRAAAGFVPSVHCRLGVVDRSVSVRAVGFGASFSRGRLQCYSTKRKEKPVKARKGAKKEAEGETEMGKEKEKEEGVYVVRKGGLVGVYRSLSECQAQAGTTIFDTPVSVFKGSLPKDSENFLASCGLQNALYTIKASDLKEGIFGTLVPCALQDPASSKGTSSKVKLQGEDLSLKRSYESLASADMGLNGLLAGSSDHSNKHTKLDSDMHTCIIEFDGASKGNPGQAGAGAVVRASDGSLICKLRQGLGTVTNNAAEYRAIILGLKYALEKGYKSVRAIGDSKLVCNQLNGVWKVKHQNMSDLHGEAKKLKDKFLSFEISHVLRALSRHTMKEPGENMTANRAFVLTQQYSFCISCGSSPHQSIWLSQSEHGLAPMLSPKSEDYCIVTEEYVDLDLTGGTFPFHEYQESGALVCPLPLSKKT